MIRNFSKNIFFVLLLFFSFQAVSKNHAIFVAFDTGDAQEIHHIIKAAEKDFNDYTIIACGQAAERFFLSHHPQKLDSTYDWKVKDREDTLDKQSIRDVFKQVQPSVVLVGMASNAQKQWAQVSKSHGTPCVGLYDACHEPKDENNPFDQAVRRVAKHVSNIILPYEGLKPFFMSITENTECVALGQPAYETWSQDLKASDPQKLLHHLQLPSKPPHVVMICGGYDDAYKASFEMITQAIPHFPDVTFLIALHPKVLDSVYEKEKIKDLKNVQIIPSKTETGNFRTEDVACLSDVILCARSTVGIKAVLGGQKVLYVEASPSQYTNFLIENKWVPQVSDQESLISELKKLLTQDTMSQPGDIMPQNSAHEIIKYMKSLS